MAPGTTRQSLIAVFLALAIGILIGAEFGGDTLNSTRRNLEHSLTGNLQDARERADQVSGELGRGERVRRPRLPGAGPQSARGPADRAAGLRRPAGGHLRLDRGRLGPTGGRLVGVGVVREPVDLHALAGDLSKTRFADIAENSDTLTAFGVGLGRQIVLNGTLLEQVRGHLFSRASGNFGGLDGVIVVRDQPEEMGPVQRGSAGDLESGMMSGIVATRAPAVGVETSTSESSSVSFFQANDISSVDDVDLVAGRLATVFALLGAEGSFGVKSSADRLLPDLLAPNSATHRAKGLRKVTWVGFPVGIAVALLVVPAGVRGLIDAGLVARTTAAAGSRFRSGRCWRRPRWSPSRRSPSSTTAATSNCSTPNCGAGSPISSAWPSSASSTTRWGGARRRTRRAAGAATPGPCARAGSRPARSRRSAPSPSPPTSSPAAASNRGATSPTWRC